MIPLARAGLFATVAAVSASTLEPQWEVVSSSPKPVIGPEQAVPHGIFQGFETGQFIKVGRTYYYVANELGLCKHVVWDRTTRAGLWSASNASGPWTRVATLRNTSSMHTLCNKDAGKGLKNVCSWAPTLEFAPSAANGSKPVWNFFYSACDAPKNHQGDGIVHAVSVSDSLEGPYVDVPGTLAPGTGVVMPFSHAFTTWQLSNGSYMSFRNNVPGATDFSVGLERALADNGRTLGGPWAYDNNSVPFPCGPENPIVTKSSDKQWYYAVYDALEQIPVGAEQPSKGCTDPSKRALCKSKTQCDQIGIAWSRDGLTWSANRTTLLKVQTGGHHPCGQIRTPLGLVAEPEHCDGCYSVLWTGFSTLEGTDGNGFTPVCHAIVKQIHEKGAPFMTSSADIVVSI